MGLGEDEECSAMGLVGMFGESWGTLMGRARGRGDKRGALKEAVAAAPPVQVASTGRALAVLHFAAALEASGPGA